MAKHKPFKQVHIILQGKGGCGKSLVGTILAQYFKLHKGRNIEAFDLDQVNTTLSQYKNLDVKHIRITEKDNINEINQRLLDGFIQAIIESDAETIIVDTGSNTFLNLLDYLIQNQIFDLFYSFQITPVIHTVIVGSGDYNDTLHGAKTIIENLSVPVVVWVNEYYGEVIERLQSSEISSDKYTHANTIAAFMLLPKLNTKLQGKDLEIFITNRLTIPEIETCKDLSLVAKIRVRKIFADYFNDLDKIGILNNNED
ncbi:hypothetical protein GAD39_17940 [Salmonella enterica]|nr:hypothetical protein [Salmonella enterica]